MPKYKNGFPSDYPKQCPCGHKHLSWSLDEKEVYCWDCNQKYSLSECFGSRDLRTPGKASERQLPLFEKDGEQRNGMNKAFKEQEPSE